MFYSSQRNIEAKKESKSQSDLVTLDSIIEDHEGLLWFWALWECAQFFVQSRLKTPIGKAQDTFVAIENSIKGFYNQLQSFTAKVLQGSLASEPSLSNDNKLNYKLKEISSDLSKVTIILHFVEYLEKLIYNAYEGTAVSLQPVQKAVKIFFRTNKSTCNEWFWRVRFFLINIAVKCNHFEIAVRHSYEYIHYALQHYLTTVRT